MTLNVEKTIPWLVKAMYVLDTGGGYWVEKGNVSMQHSVDSLVVG